MCNDVAQVNIIFALSMRDKNASNNKKKDIDWLRVLVAIGYPLPAAAILFSIYYIIYLGMDITIFLILAILTVLAYLGVATILLKPLPEDKKYSPMR